jgi:hypothetical protein
VTFTLYTCHYPISFFIISLKNKHAFLSGAWLHETAFACLHAYAVGGAAHSARHPGERGRADSMLHSDNQELNVYNVNKQCAVRPRIHSVEYIMSTSGTFYARAELT